MKGPGIGSSLKLAGRTLALAAVLAIGTAGVARAQGTRKRRHKAVAPSSW